MGKETFYSGCSFFLRLWTMVIVSMPVLFAQTPVFDDVSASLGLVYIRNAPNHHGHGLAAADFDNDGDIDLFSATTYGLHDHIYVNQGNGQFVESALQLGVSAMQNSRAALWVDYTGDGLLDLVVASDCYPNTDCGSSQISLFFYKQIQGGQFVQDTPDAGVDLSVKYTDKDKEAIGGLSAGDINNDGYVDILLTVWNGPNTFLLNDGVGGFTDISASSGLGVAARSYNWQAIMYDFNHDGWLDIYCNIDFYGNQLWINNQDGSFTDLGEQYNIDSRFNEMGLTLGDYDNDGDFDVYATNITRHFGGVDQHNVLQRNEQNRGALWFRERAVKDRIGQSGWDWGTTFFDANNDGLLDLAVTNGWIKEEWQPDQSRLWINNGDAGFQDQSTASGFDDWYSAASLISCDYDRDGDLDLVQSVKNDTTESTPIRVYQNQLDKGESRPNYLVIKPRMPGTNSYAIGAELTIWYGNMQNKRLITSGTSFYGQEPYEAFFGLGAYSRIDSLSVRWPNGGVNTLLDIEANQAMVLMHGQLLKAPRNLVYQIDAGSVILQWHDTSEDKQGFVLRKSFDKNFENYTDIRVGADETVYTDEGVSGNQVVYYKIRVFNERFSSPFSDVVAVTHPDPVVSAVANTAIENVLVYPNPAQDGFFYLKLENDFVGEIKLTLTNSAARKVWQKTFYKAHRAFNQRLALGLNPGIYTFSVTSGEQTDTEKILVK